jgi:hypothetical protein
MERKPCVVCFQKARKEALQHDLKVSTVPAAAKKFRWIVAFS